MPAAPAAPICPAAIALMQSLHRLAESPILPDDLRVLPGHGAFSTLGIERAQNPYMKG